MNCPPEFLDLYIASATFTGPLTTDVRTVRETLQRHRERLEDRESIAASLRPGDVVASSAIVGFYRTYDEAAAALDWVRAWRSGS
jgi:hypothetical protein